MSTADPLPRLHSLQGQQRFPRMPVEPLHTVHDAWTLPPASAELLEPDRPLRGPSRPATSPQMVRHGGRGVPQLRPTTSATTNGPSPPTIPAGRPTTTNAAGRANTSDALLGPLGPVHVGPGPLGPLAGEEEAPEMQRLRGEMHELQKALHHTQAALVSKYRGRGNRFVGGAQFRTNDTNPRPQSKGANIPAQPQSAAKCIDCATLKSQLKRTKHEEEGAREECCMLRARLSESEAGLTSLRHSVASIRSSLSASEAENAALRAAASEGVLSICAAGDGLNDQESNLADLADELRFALAATAARQASEGGAAASDLQMLSHELASARAAAADAQQRLHAAEADAAAHSQLADKLSAETEHRRRAEAEREEAVAAVSTVASREAGLQRSVRALTDDLTDAQKRLAELDVARGGQREARCMRAEEQAQAAREEAANYLRDLEQVRRALAESEAARQAEAERAAAAAARTAELEEYLRQMEARMAAAAAAALQQQEAAAKQQEEGAASLAERERQVSTLKATMRDMKRSAAAAASGMRDEAEVAASRLAAELELLRKRCADLEAAAAAGALERQLEGVASSALASELGSTEQELNAAASEASCASEALERTRSDLEAAKAEAAGAAAAAAALQAASGAGEALSAEVRALEQKLADEYSKRTAACESASALLSEVSELREAAAKSERGAASARRTAEAEAKQMRDQLSAAEAGQQAMEAATQALRAQLEAAQKGASSMAAEHAKLKAGMREKLDEAAQSSVRLCVVAPTVNVTFGDQMLGYKAPLPKERIRTTLESQVLPNFAKSFIQERESTAPDGTSMDDWLKDMTVTMQGSIEKHLAKVFRE